MRDCPHWNNEDIALFTGSEFGGGLLISESTNSFIIDCTTGHYHFILNNPEVHLVVCNLAKGTSSSDLVTKVNKLFVHPSKPKVKAILMDANLWNCEYNEMLENIYELCEICKWFQCILHWKLYPLNGWFIDKIYAWMFH